MRKKLRLVLLISGGGSTAEAIIKACRDKKLKGIVPVGVISSRADAPGIAKADTLGVKTFIVERKQFDKLPQILNDLRADLISQNGWLPLTPPSVVEKYQGKIINQHPGPLDPGRSFDFGGKGMYGARVICACLAYSWLTSQNFFVEATTHLVTADYDKGDLIRTIKIPIRFPVSRENLMEETKKLQVSLLPREHENVIKSLEMFTMKKVIGFRRKRPLIPKGYEKYLEQAKKIAVELFPNG